MQRGHSTPNANRNRSILTKQCNHQAKSKRPMGCLPKQFLFYLSSRNVGMCFHLSKNNPTYLVAALAVARAKRQLIDGCAVRFADG